VSSEREMRAICEKIMFNQFAPPECRERGITSPEECGRFFEDEFGFDRRGLDRGYDFGGDCRSFEDSGARLACYDRAGSGGFEDGGNFEERFRQIKEEERQCAEGCASQGKAWDFSNGCSCHGGGYQDDYSEYYEGSYDEGQYDDYYPHTTFSIKCSCFPTFSRRPMRIKTLIPNILNNLI